MSGRSRGDDSPAWPEEEGVEGIFRRWARPLGQHAEDAFQEMRIRWLRHGPRARQTKALAHVIGRTVFFDYLGTLSRRHRHEGSTGPADLDKSSDDDRTASSSEERTEARLDAARDVRLIPELLEQLRPAGKNRRQLRVYERRVDIFNKVYGEMKAPAAVAEELGVTEHWVKECLRDLMRDLAPLMASHSPPKDDAGLSGEAETP